MPFFLHRRNIIVIGKENVGKTSLINNIIGSNSLLSTEVLCHNTTRVSSTLLINNKKYHCTFIELFSYFVGLIVNTNQRVYLENLNLIIYVCKCDHFTCEEKEDFERYTEFFENVCSISALVITGCDAHNVEERAKLVEDFKSNENTKHIAASMNMGIYTVGFPDLTNHPSVSENILQSIAKMYQNYIILLKSQVMLKILCKADMQIGAQFSEFNR